jgi:hypothetical protein
MRITTAKEVKMDYQDDDMEYVDVDVADEESEEEREEREAHPCGCGNFCFNCLGMTWRDFV